MSNVRMIGTTCPICHEADTICVTERAHKRWRDGTVIQVAFPELSATQREQLITGICAPCWDQSFGEG